MPDGTQRRLRLILCCKGASFGLRCRNQVTPQGFPIVERQFDTNQEVMRLQQSHALGHAAGAQHPVFGQ